MPHTLKRNDLRYTYRDAFEGAKFPAPKWDSATHLDSEPYSTRRFPVFGHGSIGTGDYGGAADIGRSNIRVIRDQFSDLEGRVFFHYTGSFGYQDLMFRARLMTEAIAMAQKHKAFRYAEKENTLYQRLCRWCGEETADQIVELARVLRHLDEYPIVDESDLSDLNVEEWEENWNDWGAGEFLRAACVNLDLDFPGFRVASEKADALWSLYDAHGGMSNESPYCEGGNSYVFPKLEETATKVTREELIAIFGVEALS